MCIPLVVKIKKSEADNYHDALVNWKEKGKEILGNLSGEPDWLHNDETPNCDCCSKKMRFVGQLEEGPDHKTAVNFGGVVEYLCDCFKGKTAKFLWQC